MSRLIPNKKEGIHTHLVWSMDCLFSVFACNAARHLSPDVLEPALRTKIWPAARKTFVDSSGHLITLSILYLVLDSNIM